MTRRSAGFLLPFVLLLAGCTANGGVAADTQGAPSPPFADCAALTAPPGGAGRSAVTPVPGSAQPLADVELPCFTGGQMITLSAIRGPAVINLWASWCQPCREELPAFQRLASRANAKVHVVGVDTRDDRGAAESLARDLGLTFPTLSDPGEQLRLRLERNALPITLFVDGQGSLRYVHDSSALTDATLADLVRQHLAVAVQP